jgi:hypothetical protein
MATTTISQQEALDAARFLQQLIAANTTDVDVSDGSALYDQTVNALAYIAAYFQKERDGVRLRQSLRDLNNLPDDENVVDSADAILSNWFLTRPQGRYARGTAVAHLSQRVDVSVFSSTRLLKTTALAYFPDTQTSLFIPQSSLRPTIDSSGNVVDWTCQFPIVAARVGTDYNQSNPGRFIAFDRFNPYVTYVEHQTAIGGGTAMQTTRDFIAQSRTAISLRALINARSNDATLRDLFPIIEKIVTVGMGDPEMFRDVIREIASGIKIHMGGHADIYSRLPLQEVTESLTIGGRFIRNDGLAVVLRDAGRMFASAGVVPTDVLFVESGLPEAPFQYTITEVTEDTVTVSARTPFSLATDEDASLGPVLYSIGNNSPAFNNKISGLGGVAVQATQGTSRTIQQTGKVFLAARPVYKIKRVEVRSFPSTLQPYMNSTSNSIVFEPRKNGANPVGVAGRALNYNVTCIDPSNGQSALGMFAVDVGYNGHPFDGQTVEVTYDSVASFDTIDSYVRGSQTRVVCANEVVKGLHTVYLSFQVPYSLSTDPTTLAQQTLGVFDPDAAALALENFVNAYLSDDELDFSLLATQARAQSGLLGSIGTFPINYTLFGPDGSFYNYQTTDKVSLFAQPTINGASLLNPADFGLPASGYSEALSEKLAQLGISSRTVRYVCTHGAVSFYRR